MVYVGVHALSSAGAFSSRGLASTVVTRGRRSLLFLTLLFLLGRVGKQMVSHHIFNPVGLLQQPLDFIL